MNTKILEEIGLTPGEIKVYLALLKIGSSSVGPIVHEAQVSRSKIYVLLDKLEKKGLASHVEKNGVIYFQATDPKRVRDYLQQKEKTLKDIQNDFETYLPQLEAYQKEACREEKVRVYQGFKGLATAHEHTYDKLKRGEEYYYFGGPEEQPEYHHIYWQRDHQRRVKAGIKCKILFHKNTSDEIIKNRNGYTGCSARRMPIELKTPSYFLVYKDTICIIIPGINIIVIEIVSEKAAESFKAYFYEFWKKAKLRK